MADPNSGINSVYRERNACVAAIARVAINLGFRAGLGKHECEPGDDWDPEWMNVVYIDLPTGQVSWHIHESELPQFGELPRYLGRWDGHSTEEKYRRLNAAFPLLVGAIAS